MQEWESGKTEFNSVFPERTSAIWAHRPYPHPAHQHKNVRQRLAFLCWLKFFSTKDLFSSKLNKQLNAFYFLLWNLLNRFLVGLRLLVLVFGWLELVFSFGVYDIFGRNDESILRSVVQKNNLWRVVFCLFITVGRVSWVDKLPKRDDASCVVLEKTS